MTDKKRRVLAIDDDVSICEFYGTALKTLGYEVAIAGDAKGAKAALVKTRPDVVLMDIMMPDQDGISLTRELRDDPKTADIPIIVVSGLADAGTLNDALLFGAVDYMVKPINLDSLASKIERALAAADRRKRK